MEKKGLGEKLYKISISRGFVCEAGSGRIKDILIDFNLSELEDFIYQELDKAREEKIQNIFTKEEWGLMYESLIYRFGNDKGLKHLEQKILGMRKLSKLKDNK